MIKLLTEWLTFATQALMLGGVLYGIIVSRGNRKAIAVNTVATVAIAARVEEVHVATDGLTERLEKAARGEGVAIGTAVGIEKGVQQEQDRQKP